MVPNWMIKLQQNQWHLVVRSTNQSDLCVSQNKFKLGLVKP